MRVTKPVKVDIDTVTHLCDALANSLIPESQEYNSRALIAEAANYMSALPWAEKKSKTELLDFVVENNLSAREYMTLDRLQLRMQQHEHEKYLGVRHERYAEIIAPAGKSYAERINLADMEGFVEKQHFRDLKRNSQFRKLVLRKPQGDFDKEQASFIAFCEAIFLPQNQINFLRSL